MAAYRRPLPKRRPARDPQQYLVYRMESEALGHCGRMKLSDSAIESLCRAIARNYGVPDLRINWKPMRDAAVWHDNDVLDLSTTKGTSRDLITITHEMGHQIHYHLSDGNDKNHQNHGPEFMACHLSILDSCRIIPIVGMKAICDSYGIAYFDPGVDGKSLVDILKRK